MSSKADKAQLILSVVDVGLSLTGLSLETFGLGFPDPLEQKIDEVNAKLDKLAADLADFRADMAVLGEELMQELEFTQDLIQGLAIAEERTKVQEAWAEYDEFIRSETPTETNRDDAIDLSRSALIGVLNKLEVIIAGGEDDPRSVVGYLETLLFAVNTRVAVALEMEDGILAKREIAENLQRAAGIIDEIVPMLEAQLIANQTIGPVVTTSGPLRIFPIPTYDWITFSRTVTSDFLPDHRETVSITYHDVNILELAYFEDEAGILLFAQALAERPGIAAQDMAAFGFDKLELLAGNYREMSDGVDLVAPGAGGVVEGTDGNDLLTGLQGDDVLKGFGDADVLLAQSGSDTLFGGAGDDSLDGGNHPDELHGGDGRDGMEGGGGGDRLFGGGGADQLLGNSGWDVLRGGGGWDTLSGGNGRDGLFGGNGNDKVWGDGGNDRLFGEAGDDILNGGAGADTLTGGPGRDVLRGGPGADVFVFDDLDAPDKLADVMPELDMIHLDGAVFTGLGEGTLSFGRFLHGDTASLAGAQILQDGTRLLYDADGTGAEAAIHFAWIGNGVDLDRDDFLIV